jgi:hypothetical protein
MYLTHRLRTLERSSVLSRAKKPLGRYGLAPSLVLGGMLLAGLVGPGAASAGDKIDFDLVRAAGLVSSGCLPDATGHVKVEAKEQVEEMEVKVEGLPPDTGFDLFVIQVPGAPFGLAWYQGDIQTKKDGKGHGKFVGRFNIETFIVATGSDIAPTPHDDLDASTNPVTKPVHTWHIGLWFNSPADAVAAGCPGATTPFNGDHTAGIQALNTSQFAKDQGPLGQLGP